MLRLNACSASIIAGRCKIRSCAHAAIFRRSSIPAPGARHCAWRHTTFEQFNARYGDFNLNGTQVARVADSDSYSAGDLRQSKYCTILQVSSLSWVDVFDAIRAGRTTPLERAT